ncbi:MAG TPA: polyphosphate polymerase domain-containing protein, partial [Clostridiales bacterium]|nr:polyphosphate polymerase domain-containing protein [Clostridiales bacterium]
MEAIKFRHEIKHYINMMDYYIMRNRFKAVMQADIHGDVNNEYIIRSLYFDNFYDSALYEKISGVNNREKFRIRFYNGDTSLIRLEKKQKCNNLTAKFSAVVSRTQCEKLLIGDIGWMRESEVSLVTEFYVKMQSGLLKPKTIVDYVREAYTYPAGNVRITFDKSVRTGLFSTKFFDNNFPAIETLDKGLIILEVKFDGFLPEVISDVLQTNERRQTSVLKYAL